ncbi:MAG: hypothetical protein U0840_05815 [Gemmataceae bacterium]
MFGRLLLLVTIPALGLLCSLQAQTPNAATKFLPGTEPLTMTGDIASQLVEGVDRFLLQEIARSAQKREQFWKRDHSSAQAYEKSIEPNRQRLRHILGVRDARIPFHSPELVATLDQSSLVGQGPGYEVRAVRWPVIGQISGEGLVLLPTGGKARAHVVAIPDADVTPEQFAGLAPGVPADMQFARLLAESGCRVLVPTLIDRTYAARAGRAKMTSREFLYRSAFELGRHLIGYEVQTVLAGVDWFVREGATPQTIGVIGHGEGGMLALYTGALDSRIGVVGVSGYFGPRERIWEQPIDRNVFGLLEQFGDAELGLMVAPRPLVIGALEGPKLTLPSEGGAPAVLRSPTQEEVEIEIGRMQRLTRFDRLAVNLAKQPGKFVHGLMGPLGTTVPDKPMAAPKHLRKDFNSQVRQARLFDQIDRHNQTLLEDAHNVRRDFLPIADQFGRPDDQKKLNTSSLAAYEKSIERYREFFATDVIGRFDLPLLPPKPRSRFHSESEKWIIYQVVMDVYPDVIAYGLLIVPKDLRPGEKRPVVVCQHGLEGRPEDCISNKQGYEAYKAFATRLAERGFITFAPQNLYIFRDRFRTLQRKANPIKKTLFSVIVPQHQQITDWLKTLPFVDGSRIGFYGLSYGGKTAMRVPALVKNYALSICSADFNDWVWKNASTRDRYSYVWTLEYEIFEFDLGSTFNYAEMAALIAPRPFMVERGHFDGVAPDERVALEFARVRHLFSAKLGIGDRATLEWFVGPHTINGKGTFEFLHRHLRWPAPGEKR